MEFKWVGAMLIVAGCGGFGFTLSAEHRLEEKSLRKLIGLLDFITCELRYRMTPLPELCEAAAAECGGDLGKIFHKLSLELETAETAEVSGAMETALRECGRLPVKTRDNLLLLGRSMGRFDLEGQLSGLEAVRAACRRELDNLSVNRDSRLRNYQTLGLCAGAALAIILV